MISKFDKFNESKEEFNSIISQKIKIIPHKESIIDLISDIDGISYTYLFKISDTKSIYIERKTDDVDGFINQCQFEFFRTHWKKSLLNKYISQGIYVKTIDLLVDIKSLDNSTFQPWSKIENTLSHSQLNINTQIVKNEDFISEITSKLYEEEERIQLVIDKSRKKSQSLNSINSLISRVKKINGIYIESSDFGFIFFPE